MNRKVAAYRCRTCSVLLPDGVRGHCSEHCRTAKARAHAEAKERARKDANAVKGDGRRGEHPDPVNHDVPYTDDQLEFLRAVEHYRRTRKRPFPTACDYLRIAISLGYRKTVG